MTARDMRRRHGVLRLNSFRGEFVSARHVVRRFPAVLDGLETGLVHLTAVRLLAPILTVENHRSVPAAAAHKSKRGVEELLARLRPGPDVPAQVRKLPGTKRPERTHRPAEGMQRELRAGGTGIVVPLAPERYKVQFTASAGTRRQLQRAQELLRHRIPDGDVAAIVGLALDLLVRDLERKKFAATDRPRPENAPLQPNSSSRHIPAAVKRAVWARDEGCCTFRSATGVRCGARDAIEFDHIRPHADGGEATVSNVRLLCRHHNQHAALQYFGPWQADDRSGSAPRYG